MSRMDPLFHQLQRERVRTPRSGAPAGAQAGASILPARPLARIFNQVLVVLRSVLAGLSPSVDRLFFPPAANTEDAETAFYDPPAHLRKRAKRLTDEWLADEARRIHQTIHQVQERIRTSNREALAA